ncbi:PAS domain S-box protein [Laspinema olomoucense]|uniref:PAS domain S-box protein n=1 Tax=Laspinema olomoucense TaxID=3231600 RepID=UPI0021BAEE87|nr:PAS domain S-box protein [Laspinema sp. D3a]MCT7990431.1 PAS domain S-box protein [Laspinema sp. D3a]
MDVEDNLVVGGEMGRLMGRIDWTATPLGAMENWPGSLHNAVNLSLTSPVAIAILWGPDWVQFYNDAYHQLLQDTQQLRLFGQPVRDCWTNRFPAMARAAASVFATGQAYQLRDQRFECDRCNCAEEVTIALSSSPIFDELGEVAGIFNIITRTPGTPRTLYNEADPSRVVSSSLSLSEGYLEGEQPLKFPPFEESLESANQGVSHVLESIPDGFIAFDGNWRFIYVNSLAGRLLERSPDELLGKAICEELSAPGSKLDWLNTPALQRSQAQRIPVTEQYCLSESNQWMEISAFPLDEGIGVYIRDISDRQRTQQRQLAQYAIAKVLAEAPTWVDAVPAILQALCETLGCQVGTVWTLNPQDNRLHSFQSWHFPGLELQEFLELTGQISLAPGVGLPGRIWETRQPVWIADLETDENFPRAAAAIKAGLRSACGFPIRLGDKLLAAIECFSDRLQAPDPDLLDLMAALGSQIGQFIERQRTEDALRESQELFSHFMNHSPFAAFIKDAAGRKIYVNAALERLLQRPSGEIVGKTDFELFPLEVATQWQINDRQVLEQNAPIQFLETIEQENGETCYYMSYKFPFRDRAGQQFLAGVSLDISDRIRVQAALQENERRLSLALSAANAGIWEWNLTSDRWFWCDENYRLLGYAPGHCETTYQNWLQAVHPDDRQTVEASVQTTLNTPSNFNLEYRVLLPNGSIRWLSNIGETLLDENGQIKGMSGIQIDITERKRTEEALRSSAQRLSLALEAAKMGDCTWDLARDRATLSPRAAEILGIGPEQVLTCAEIQKMFHEDDRGQVQSIMERAIRDRLPYDIEYRIRRPDGSQRWLAVKGLAQYDANGQVLEILGVMQDITDRKQEDVKKQELLDRVSMKRKLLNAILEQLPAGVIVAEAPSGNILLFNDQIKQMARIPDLIPLDNLNQPPLYEAFYPDGRAYQLQDWPLYRSVYSGEVVRNEEIHFGRGDGTKGIILVNSAPVYDENGTIRAGVVTFSDITERYFAAEAIRQTEGVYRAIGESLDYGIWICDRQGHHLYASDSFLRLVGMTLEEWKGLGWVQVLEPQAAQQTLADWTQGATTGNLWDREQLVRGVDGNWHPILVRGVPVRNQAGEIICWAGINLDISRLKKVEGELRESEYRFRLLADKVPIQIWMQDEQACCHFVNERYREFTGLCQSDITQDWTESLHPDDWASYIREYSLAIAHRKEHRAIVRMRRYDGVYRWMEVLGLPRFEGTRFVGYVGCNTDITERKQAEEEREQLLARERAAREESEAANRIKDEFLAVLSHELRSPLNPILGWSRLLRTRQFDDASRDRALETIERNARLLSKLIEDLLDVSRILQGKIALHVGPVELVSTLESALETVQLAASSKEIQISTHFESEIGLVSGDRDRIQQIIWNLLSNAVKFTPSGGQVDVYLQRKDGCAQIRVKDTGKGIDREFLPYVFDLFRQQDGKTTRQFGGLGLGLAIVRYLTELHGGTVAVTSLGEGQGATFTICLPLTLDRGTPGVSLGFDSVSELEALPLTGVQILLVDDEADMRELATTILAQAGAKVEVAASAVEATQCLDRHSFDILVTDIGMPDIDGYMLIQQVRTRPSERGGAIPAIALTAYAGESNQQKALQAGFQLHLPKPVEPEILIKAIEQLITG